MIQLGSLLHQFDADGFKLVCGRHVWAITSETSAPLCLLAQVRCIDPDPRIRLGGIRHHRLIRQLFQPWDPQVLRMNERPSSKSAWLARWLETNPPRLIVFHAARLLARNTYHARKDVRYPPKVPAALTLKYWVARARARALLIRTPAPCAPHVQLPCAPPPHIGRACGRRWCWEPQRCDETRPSSLPTAGRCFSQ
jgi:hypothetical protein